jgi:hypothetical protein
MTISRNISVMAQGASSSGILAGGYGGLGASVSPTTAGNTIFTTNGTTWSSTAKIILGTPIATTSGTSIDFTSIPSWIKRVKIMFSGVSTNGTSLPIVQIGSGSVQTTGYLGSGGFIGSSTGASQFTTGFGLATSGATNIFHGALDISLFSSSSFTYVASGGVSLSNIAFIEPTYGSVSLSGLLDRVRLTTVNGTDTFDAGSVNILYE